MDSVESTLIGKFKSKKVLDSSSDPKPPPSPSIKVPDCDPWSSKTPEKSVIAPRRSRNRSSALSLKEVKEAAQKLRKSDPEKSARPDPLLISSPPDSPVAKSKKPTTPSKLPEKYEILGEFFNGLDSSTRLLRIKGSKATFTNISLKIQSLTDRRFSHRHLAQLKFILPEAIEIKKILVQDERTSCMKPDLHVTLNASAIEDNGKTKPGTESLVMRKVFRSRLLDFFKSHPEGDDIPEEELPEPFNQSKHYNLENAAKSSGSSSTSVAANESVSEHRVGLNLSKPPASASHLSRSFRRSFSQRSTISIPEDNTKQEQAVARTDSSENSHTILNATPMKESSLSKVEEDSVAAEGTPAKLAFTPAKLMSSTPMVQHPKRCYMTPEDDCTRSPNKLIRRPSRGRLDFDSPVKNDLLDVLSPDILQSIQEKERIALEEKDPAISQAKWRRQMVASLPKMFDMIYFLFQSIKRSVITKEELKHKIISSHLEIIDSREIEEQLRLLHELAPEWIYEKPASTGDLLICVNKIASPEPIRSRLANAK